VCLSDARRAAVAFVQDDTMVERLRLPFSVAENVMNGAHIEQLAAGMPLAKGYRLELLKREEIGALIVFIATWFPDISVGGASCYLRDDFYTARVFFAGGPERDGLVLLLKQGSELAGMFSLEFDLDTLSVYARLGVAAPRHRGAGLARAGMAFTEAMGHSLGMGLAYGMATLKAPHAQRAFERAGWQLIGITPGYDREMVAPGVVKRVYEAVYTKVLVADAGLLRPQRQNLTPRTQAFFESLFSADHFDPASVMEMPDAAAC
jgi:GNAT superfamily N-acetyltransferase